MYPRITPAAKSDDRLATLKALRDRLAKQIDETDSSRDVAALSRQLTDVLAQIASLEGANPKEDDFADLISDWSA